MGSAFTGTNGEQNEGIIYLHTVQPCFTKNVFLWSLCMAVVMVAHTDEMYHLHSMSLQEYENPK